MTFSYTTVLAAALASAAFAAPGKHHRPHGDPHRATIAQINAGLAGTPLAGYGQVIDRAAARWNVSPFLIASIAGVESSFGAAACGGNAWGISSCRGVSLTSFTAGAWYVAQLLRTGYIGRGLMDVWSIGRVYCPPCGSSWGTNVAFFLRSRFHVGLAVTYPWR